MSTRTTAILTVISIALGASALGARAETDGALQRQLDMSDGAPRTEPATIPAPTNHETPRQAATNSWFERERAQPTVVVPYVAPKSDSTLAAQPAASDDAQGD
jgi:hypothetical protein